MRIGNGFDFHLFIENKPLVLGGVTIEYPLGLKADSDGDVVLHSLSDALLGAASLGSIGNYFSKDNASGISSKIIIEKVLSLLEGKYIINNIDITIVLDEPKIEPYREEIIKSISSLCSLDISKISVKAKSLEGVYKEGIFCLSNVLLEEYGRD